ncbi:MAG: hypothetical protein ABIJ86_03080 [Spirochaetota bacterium]
MKRSMTILFALALAISLASCTFLDDLLNVNLFEETFELSTSDVTSSSVDELLVQSESDTFFETVEADPALKTAVLDKTLAVINDTGATPLAVQEAGILGASVIIYTSPAGDLLANATGLADGLPENATMEDLLDLIMPDSVYLDDGVTIDPEEFGKMIDAFVEANQYYTAIGDNLGDDYLTSSASAGDIAVGAYLAAVLVSIDYTGYTDIGDYLYAVLEEGVTPPDFTAPDTTLPSYAYLDAILGAANLGDLLNL